MAINGEVYVQEGQLKGFISQENNLEATIISEQTMIGNVDIAMDYDTYNGKTVVDAEFHDQVLNTENKYVKDDILVKSIKVSYTPNESGGQTVYIG